MSLDELTSPYKETKITPRSIGEIIIGIGVGIFFGITIFGG